MATDFAGAFSELKEILRKHAGGMHVLRDTPTEFVLVTSATAPNGKPMWFGNVSVKKSAVTYHLMPLYYNPVLEAAVTPELAPCKQGKTCFNFQSPDDGLFKQLDALTGLAREHFARQGMLDPGPVSAERLAEALRAVGHDPEAIARLRKEKGAAAAKKRATTRGQKVRKTSQ